MSLHRIYNRPKTRRAEKLVKSIDSKDIKEEMVEVAPDINIWKNRIDPKLSSLVIQRCDEIGFERSKTFEKSSNITEKMNRKNKRCSV